MTSANITPPTTPSQGIASGIFIAAAQSLYSPIIEKFRIIKDSSHPNFNKVGLVFPGPKTFKKSLQSLPFYSCKNLYFFSLYPFVKKATDGVTRSDIQSQALAASISGFAQNAFPLQREPHMAKTTAECLKNGVKGGAYFGSFFTAAPLIAEKLDIKEDSLKNNASLGAIAGMTAQIAENTVEGMSAAWKSGSYAKIPSLIIKNPNILRSSATGAAFLSSLALANKAYHKYTE
ncbi:MAG: hypothetical protein Tsb0015_08930 [Simkaniaceae bacterium]